MNSLQDLKKDLNSFDAEVRRTALEELLKSAPHPRFRPVANNHLHSFFSFNAEGHSPTSLAWLARENGISLAGIVDFDVLDGIEEFLEAADRAGVRGSAGMETRVFIPEFGDREINSPGEPGIFYHMGIGFTSCDVPAESASILERMRMRASGRNRLIIERVNEYLRPIAIDYDRDVLPLTPSGNPTERHMVSAYMRAADIETQDAAAFWEEKIGARPEGDPAAFQNQIRSRLMKKGGVGYIAPTSESFPAIEEVNLLITACGAIPCATWLDGTSQGEQDMEELLSLLMRKGVSILNVIPDRNWNIRDSSARDLKIRNLYKVMDLAESLCIPVIAGTEMNSFGQKPVDDFDSEALSPLRERFLNGAYFIYGHTVLQKMLGIGFQSPWAFSHMPERKIRNQFYAEAGRLVKPGEDGRMQFAGLAGGETPEKILENLS